MLHMKKHTILFISFLFLARALYSQDFWEPISPPDDSLHTSGIAVDSSGYIYISNYIGYVNYGGIYRSIDNGQSWQLKGFKNSNLLSVAVNPYNNDIYTGGFGKIYKSSNEGDTWSIAYSYFSFSIVNIKFGYDSIVFAAAEEALIRSADYGETWKVVIVDSCANCQEVFTDVAFSSDGIIYACSKTWYGGNGEIYYSTDLGNTWQVFGFSNYFSSLAIDNSGNILAGGVGLFRYNVAEQNWEQLLANSYWPYDILVTPDNKIFLACTNENHTGTGGAYVSENNGQSFERINSGLRYDGLSRIIIDNSGQLLATNTDVYRSFDTIVTSSSLTTMSARSQLKCYPNPFSDYVNINLEDDVSVKGDDYQIKVYDVYGKIVFNNLIKQDSHYRWKPENLKPGLYCIYVFNSSVKYAAKIIKTQ